MKTGNANFVRHTYEVSKELKSYTVYKLVDEVVNNAPHLLTDIIRVEPFMQLSNGKGFCDYLRIRNQSNWKKCNVITGLKFTKNKDLFYGDCDKPHLIGCNKQTLLIFRFENDPLRVIIDVFKDYYPFNDNLLKNLV